MEITYWDIAEADDLAHVYNDQVAGVPHCYPVSPAEFGSGIRSLKNDKHFRELDWEKIIIGKQSGRIIGHRAQPLLGDSRLRCSRNRYTDHGRSGEN